MIVRISAILLGTDKKEKQLTLIADGSFENTIEYVTSRKSYSNRVLARKRCTDSSGAEHSCERLFLYICMQVSKLVLSDLINFDYM